MCSTIKTEIEKVDFDDPELLLNSTASSNSSEEMLTKCGEVFLQHRQQQELFIFICTLCEKKFEMLKTFTQHIQDAHLIDESTKLVEADINNEEQDKEDELQCVPKEEDFNEYEQHFIDVEADMKRYEEEDFSEEEQHLIYYNESTQQELEFLHAEANDTDASNMPTNAALTANSPVIAFEHSEEDEKLIDEQFLTCKDCGKDFKHTKELSQHICSSWEDDGVGKLFQCSQCAKCFNRKANLKTHEISHQAIKPYACDHCSGTFANKQNLVIHMRRHTGEKPFECSYCQKAFVSSTERNSHERCHTGTRPYVCEECGKRHTTSSQLLEHRKKHTDERSYQCGDCEKCFRTSSHLRAHHMAIHANLPRSHRCRQCAAGFKTAPALQQHAKIHEEIKHYKCRVCGKEFAQHAGLYAHMKTHTR